MQPVELDALEALLAKASPGEWTASSHDWFALRTHALIICDRPPVFYAESHAAWPDNSTAIAALYNAAPDLIAEARMLRVVRLALERALREREAIAVELAGLRRDAARYQWLRKGDLEDLRVIGLPQTEDVYDRELDAEMKEAPDA